MPQASARPILLLPVACPCRPVLSCPCRWRGDRAVGDRAAGEECATNCRREDAYPLDHGCPPFGGGETRCWKPSYRRFGASRLTAHAEPDHAPRSEHLQSPRGPRPRRGDEGHPGHRLRAGFSGRARRDWRPSPREVRRACERIGFFYLAGHGVPARRGGGAFSRLARVPCAAARGQARAAGSTRTTSATWP